MYERRIWIVCIKLAGCCMLISSSCISSVWCQLEANGLSQQTCLSTLSVVML